MKLLVRSKLFDTLKMIAFWDMALSGLTEVNCLHHQGDRLASLKRRPTSTRIHSAISQKAIIFMLTAVRTRSLTL
jgi:hypothetical protein